MNRYDEIKNLLKASRSVLSNRIDEQVEQNIKKNYGIILEQEEDVLPNVEEKEYETADSDKEEVVKKTDKKRAYRISGGIIVIHGDDKQKTQLTTEDKIAFQETMDEFTKEVSELVDFNKLNLYENNVEWSGKITELDIEFFYTIGEKNGIYINGTMTKIDDEFLQFLVDLRKFYEKFKSKWSNVIAVRKKTPR
jgi:DNA-binding Lrp family transcriptional regulator